KTIPPACGSRGPRARLVPDRADITSVGFECDGRRHRETGGKLKSVALGCAGLAFVIIAPALAADLQGPDTSQTSSHTTIWYAHNSGWFVETPRHLLVFDFVGTGIQDTVSQL